MSKSCSKGKTHESDIYLAYKWMEFIKPLQAKQKGKMKDD